MFTRYSNKLKKLDLRVHKEQAIISTHLSQHVNNINDEQWISLPMCLW
jgi:hypothetical protein